MDPITRNCAYVSEQALSDSSPLDVGFEKHDLDHIKDSDTSGAAY